MCSINAADNKQQELLLGVVVVFQRRPLMEDWGWTVASRPTLPISTAVCLSSSNTKFPALLIDSDLGKEYNCEGTVHLEAGPSFQEAGKQPWVDGNVQKSQQECWKLQEMRKNSKQQQKLSLMKVTERKGEQGAIEQKPRSKSSRNPLPWH